MRRSHSKRKHLTENEPREEALEGIINALIWLSGEAFACGMAEVSQLILRAASRAKYHTVSRPAAKSLH